MGNDQHEEIRTAGPAQIASLMLVMLAAFAILLHGLNARPTMAAQGPAGSVAQPSGR